jgi:lysyl-tRNA synthetase, class II
MNCLFQFTKRVTNNSTSVFKKRFYNKNISTSSDENYRKLRMEEISKFEKEKEISVYPTKYLKSTISILNFKEKYEYLKEGEKLNETFQNLIGRIIMKREASKKLIFLTIQDSNQNIIQIMSSKQNFEEEEEFEINKLIKRGKIEIQIQIKGDIISIRGFPGKTGTGELSLISNKIEILSPCLHQLPMDYNEIELRYRSNPIPILNSF